MEEVHLVEDDQADELGVGTLACLASYDVPLLGGSDQDLENEGVGLGFHGQDSYHIHKLGKKLGG